jgi:hypothetical protein
MGIANEIEVEWKAWIADFQKREHDMESLRIRMLAVWGKLRPLVNVTEFATIIETHCI